MSTKVQCQNSDAPKSLGNTYFLKHCYVVQKPGSILPNQNMIIRDGIIADIGPNIKMPYDAQMVATDTMYVYAGFIDCYSNTGVTKPENKDKPKVDDPGNPPNDVVGITPQLLANDVYKNTDKTVEEMRNAGFCLSHIAPRGNMLPGQSSLYLLGTGDQNKMLLKSAIGQTLQLKSMRNFYPGSSIAILAKFRDLYKNAQIVGGYVSKYQQNPSGQLRPNYNSESLALYPVTTQKTPLYFVAEKTKDLHKALSLQNELGFKLVLTEVKQGWQNMDQIKKSNANVLLSIELPDDEKKSVKKDTIAVKASEKEMETKKDSLARNTDEIKIIDQEQKAFDERKAASVKEYLAQAGVFEKNGVKFGFSFIDTKPSTVQKSLKTMIKNGLSEEGALAALTTNAAQILGVSDVLGTVEKGKIANLVITNKSYFEEESQIQFVFVDGHKYIIKEKDKKTDAKKSDKSMSLEGKWSYTVEIPGSIQTGEMNIQGKASGLVISIQDSSTGTEKDEAQQIQQDGNHLSFYILADMGTPTKVDFDLTFDGKSYTGNISIDAFGTFAIKGDYLGEPNFNSLKNK